MAKIPPQYRYPYDERKMMTRFYQHIDPGFLFSKAVLLRATMERQDEMARLLREKDEVRPFITDRFFAALRASLVRPGAARGASAGRAPPDNVGYEVEREPIRVGVRLHQRRELCVERGRLHPHAVAREAVAGME